MRGVIDKSLFAAGLVVLVAATAYFNGIDGDFVFDDIPLVSTDEFYSDPGTSTMDCWSRSYWRDGMDIGQYRPVTLFSFLLNARLAGMSSPWFRFVNLLLHIAVSLLVLKLTTRLGLNRETAIFAALLFAAHPLHSEAVIPATGRAELLCAAFILLGLIAYSKIPIFPSRALKFESDAISFATMKTTALILAPPLFFILACWSKENGVVLLPLCILYDVCFRRKHDGLTKNIFSTSDNNTGGEPTTTPTGVSHPSESKNSKTPFTLVSFLKNYAGFAVALAILAVSRLAATGSVIPKLAGRDIFIDNPICNAPTGVRILTAFHVQGMALLKFVWPATLSHDYSFARITPVSSIFDPLAIFAVFSLLVLPFAIFRFLTRPARPAFLFLWGAYIASILPAGNFIVPTGTIFGERLTYLPSVWLCLAAAAVVFFAFSRIERKISSKRLFLPEIFMGLAILAAVLRTSVRTDDWKSMRTLAVSAVETSPLSVKTWNNLAIEFAHQERFEEAIAACDRALAIKPDFQSPKVNKIYYLIALKRYGEAKRELIDVLTNGSDDYDLYNKLAGILAREGKLREAAKLLRKSLFINPNQKQIADSLKRMEKDIH